MCISSVEMESKLQSSSQARCLALSPVIIFISSPTFTSLLSRSLSLIHFRNLFRTRTFFRLFIVADPDEPWESQTDSSSVYDAFTSSVDWREGQVGSQDFPDDFGLKGDVWSGSSEIVVALFDGQFEGLELLSKLFQVGSAAGRKKRGSSASQSSTLVFLTVLTR